MDDAPPTACDLIASTLFRTIIAFFRFEEGDYSLETGGGGKEYGCQAYLSAAGVGIESSRNAQTLRPADRRV